MALSGIKIGQQVAWNGELWAVWAQAPGPRLWHLYRHPDLQEGSSGAVAASAFDMFLPAAEGIRLSLERMNKKDTQ